MFNYAVWLLLYSIVLLALVLEDILLSISIEALLNGLLLTAAAH